LRIEQWDSTLFASLIWNSGVRDTSMGYVRFDGTAIIGYAGGQFTFKGGVDTAGYMLRGYFTDSLRRIAGNLEGTRTVCDTVIEPPVDTNPKACFTVTQTLTRNKTSSGRLALEAVGDWYWGLFHWTGFPSNYAGWDTFTGSLQDSTSLNIHTTLPVGMTDASRDSVVYRIDILPSGTSNGKVYNLLPTEKSIGTWKAVRTECLDGDFKP
jgi:hypothetical protein